jgi:hypothetical protein
MTHQYSTAVFESQLYAAETTMPFTVGRLKGIVCGNSGYLPDRRWSVFIFGMKKFVLPPLVDEHNEVDESAQKKCRPENDIIFQKIKYSHEGVYGESFRLVSIFGKFICRGIYNIPD